MLGTKFFIAVALGGFLTIVDVSLTFRTVCYYDSRSFWRKDVVKISADELRPALNYCTHLVYGYVGIDGDEFQAKSLDPKLDLSESNGVKGGKENFRSITALKKDYPNITILLSVGGNADVENPSKYLTALETPQSRTQFAITISEMAKTNGFDGIDLAWQFPVITEKYEKNSWSSFFHNVAKSIWITSNDLTEAEHKEQFTALVREVRGVLNAYNCPNLSISILPHVNSSVYIDFPGLQKYVDHFTLMSYDFHTPDRTRKMADHASPLKFVNSGRLAWQNVESLVNTAIDQQIDRNKLVLGISTFGRTWKINTYSDKSGAPPLNAAGPGEGGTYTKTDGLLAYYEICPHLVESSTATTSSTLYRRIADEGKSLGTYAFRWPNNKLKGIWISFEEPETAKQKATYVKQNNLGGLALMDLSLDDARGICDLSKYPILKAVKQELESNQNEPILKGNPLEKVETETLVPKPKLKP